MKSKWSTIMSVFLPENLRNTLKKTRPACSEATLIRSKRPFTLVEMLLVLALISLVAGVVSFGAMSMLKEQRFRSGVELVIDKLRMAQQIMLVYDTDVSVILDARSGEGIKYKVESDRILPPEVVGPLLQPPIIPGIQGIAFEDDRYGRQNEVVEIKFSSIGKSTSRGKLLFSNDAHLSKDSLQREILFPGYPYPIGSDVKDYQTDIYSNESNRLYPQLIRDNWVRKTQEKNLKKNQEKEDSEDKHNPAQDDEK